MRAREIVIPMAGTAFFRRHSEAGWTSSHIHRVRMHVIPLPRIISFRMAIHAAWMPQYRNKCREERSIVAGGRGRMRRGRGLGCNRGTRNPQRSSEGRQNETSHEPMHARHTASVIRMGNLRIRLPVAAKIAFAIAGAAQGTPGSPTPPD